MKHTQRGILNDEDNYTGNNIGDEGRKSICEALVTNTTLTDLPEYSVGEDWEDMGYS